MMDAAAAEMVENPLGPATMVREPWVMDLTCPRCGVLAQPNGRAFVFGVFDGRGYSCGGCGRSFNAFYRDGVLSHTTPKAEVARALDQPVQADVDVQVRDENAVTGAVPPEFPVDIVSLMEEAGSNRGPQVMRPRDTSGSPEEVIGIIRRLREDVGQISELSAEEGNIVEAFSLAFLNIMEPLTKTLPVDPEILGGRFGAVERANIVPKGELVMLMRDGRMESVNLTEPENRDMLVSVVSNVIPRFNTLVSRRRERIEKRIAFLSSVTRELQTIADAFASARTGVI